VEGIKGGADAEVKLTCVLCTDTEKSRCIWRDPIHEFIDLRLA